MLAHSIILAFIAQPWRALGLTAVTFAWAATMVALWFVKLPKWWLKIKNWK